MKNSNQLIQAALGLAVLVLFYLQFSGKSVKSSSDSSVPVPAGNYKVAYFEGDSLQNQFEIKEELKKWCNYNQPYYKKHIPGVYNYFKNKAGL